jgi:hypothetical protein
MDSSEGQIDKGANSKPVNIVFDVITQALNQGECMKIGEDLQNELYEFPIEVPDFNIDLVTMTGATALTEESSDDERTINRILINYNYTLTQTNF